MRLRAFFLLLTVLLAFAGCGGTQTLTFDPPAPAPAPEPFQPSVVVGWNEAILATFTVASPRPTVNARALFILHASIYEAWAAYDELALGLVLGGQLRRPEEERTDENKRIAISYAAYGVLTRLFPAYETATGAYANEMAQLGLATDAATLANVDPTSPIGIGNLAAQAVLTSRANDGSNEANNFVDVVSATYPTLYMPVNSADPLAPNAPGGPTFDPQRWQPLRVPNGTFTDPVTGFPVANPADPTTFADQRFLTPQWGAVTPFALTSGSQLRPPAPPVLGSNAPYTDARGVTTTSDIAYRTQVDEVISLSAVLTETEKVIAEYWADGPASVTPPGHWNEFAQDLSYKYQYGIDDDARLFFALNGALLDSSINCWECKRAYDFIRPISAIQNLYFNQMIQGWAGPGLGTQTILGQNWRPFQRLTFITPAFAEYTSGHSTFSASGAEVLRQFTGSDELYDGVTTIPHDRNLDGANDLLGEWIQPPDSLTIEPGLPSQPITLRWLTLKDAANEAGFSRRVGGIHFRDGDFFGRRAGEQIGAQAIERARRLWTGQG